MFVNSTCRWTKTCMSTSGSGTRSSATTQTARKTAALAKSPRTPAEVQPQLSPSVSASSRDTSPAESRSAPRTSTREADVTGDCGRSKPAGDGDWYGAEDEDPPPREVVDDETGEDDPEPAAHPKDCRDEADPDADLLPGELVADDSEAQRKHRCADSLEGAKE